MHPVTGLTTRFVLLTFLSLLSVNGIANASSLETQKQALDIIADFADRLCTTVPLTGSASNLELSGDAKAKLSELIKKIADLGIEGAAKYQTSSWEGVLQQDLAGQLNTSRDCKVKVLGDLKDKLLASVAAEDRPAQLHVTFPDVLDDLKKRDANFERDPLGGRVFWLLREPGASITLGTCPGPECLQFTLGQLRPEGGSLIQDIFLTRLWPF